MSAEVPSDWVSDAEIATADNTLDAVKFGSIVEVGEYDKVAAIGKGFATIGRSMGNTITTRIAESRGNYRVRITVELVKVKQL